MVQSSQKWEVDTLGMNLVLLHSVAVLIVIGYTFFSKAEKYIRILASFDYPVMFIFDRVLANLVNFSEGPFSLLFLAAVVLFLGGIQWYFIGWFVSIIVRSLQALAKPLK